MYFLTTYTLTGKRTKKKTAKLLELFAQRGATPGTIAHYVYSDGGGGFLIGDETILERLYEDSIHYAPWMEFSTRPIHSVEDGLAISAGWANS
jgi:hypothetical protein